MNWIIRPATSDDAQGVINILNPIIEEAREAADKSPLLSLIRKRVNQGDSLK